MELIQEIYFQKQQENFDVINQQGEELLILIFLEINLLQLDFLIFIFFIGIFNQILDILVSRDLEDGFSQLDLVIIIMIFFEELKNGNIGMCWVMQIIMLRICFLIYRL